MRQDPPGQHSAATSTLSPSDVREPILHVIGDLTLYRVSEHLSTERVATEASRMAWERHAAARRADREAECAPRIAAARRDLELARNRQSPDTRRLMIVSAFEALNTKIDGLAQPRAAAAQQLVAAENQRLEALRAVEEARAILARAETALTVADEAVTRSAATIASVAQQDDALRAEWNALAGSFAEIDPTVSVPPPGSPELPNTLRTIAEDTSVNRHATQLQAEETRRTEILDLEAMFLDAERNNRLRPTNDRIVIQAALDNLRGEGVVDQSPKGWHLTRPGIKEAVRVRPTFTKVNITARLLAGICTEDAVAGFEKYLESKCRRSAAFNEIKDLVNIFMEKILARDGLATRLLAGKPVPSRGALKFWVYRSALSQFRDEGRDALTRSFKGARTERDLRGDENLSKDLLAPDVGNRILTLCDDDDGQPGTLISAGGGGGPVVDVVGGDMEQEMLDRFAFEEGISKLEGIVSRQKGPSDRFARVLRLCAEGFTLSEIAEKENVPKGRASALLADIREALRRTVLNFIINEPCSTIEDIREDVGPISYDLMKQLLDAELVSVQRGGSFVITEAGKAAARVRPRGRPPAEPKSEPPPAIVAVTSEAHPA